MRPEGASGEVSMVPVDFSGIINGGSSCSYNLSSCASVASLILQYPPHTGVKKCNIASEVVLT